MIKMIGGTILTRFLTLLGAFLIVILNTNTLGSEGQGTVALISFAIMCILAISNYIGGGAVVYLTPRIGVSRLIAPAYLWSVLVSVVIFIILKFTALSVEYALEICLMALLHGLFTFHMQILLGKQRIKAYNALQIIQVFSLLFFLFYHYIVIENQSIGGYIRSLMYSFTFVYWISFRLVSRYFKKVEFHNLMSTWREIMNYSKYAQTANVLQILNYRLNFLLMEKIFFISRGTIGVYSVGMYMSEAVWNFSKSFSLIQYSKISNVDNEKYSIKLTTTFFKISMFITLIVLTVLLAVPESLYTFVFGESFEGIKSVLWFISPGIFANSGSVILSHHFSGIGKYKFNTIASAIGLSGTLIAGLLLIGPLEMKGASITFSIAMIVQFIYLIFVYKNMAGIALSQLLINKRDIQVIKDRLF